MRKIVLCVLLVCFITKTFSQSIQFGFEWNNGSVPSCNPFVVDTFYIGPVANFKGDFVRWHASHGSPNLIGDLYNICNLEVSNTSSNSSEQSEGVFIKVPFEECYYYDVSLALKRTEGTCGVYVIAANNLSARTETSCILQSIPQVSNTSTIIYELSAPQPPLGAFTSIENNNFLATKSFDYLWIYPSTSYGYAGKISILDANIVKMGHEEIPPTIPQNLVISNKTATGFKVSWSASTDNVRVKGYEVYINDSYHGTTTNPYFTFSSLTTNQIYSVKVRAFDPVSNFSAFSESSSVYITPELTISGSSSTLCSARSYETASYTNATYSWSVSQAATVSNGTSYLCTITPLSGYHCYTDINLTRTMTLDGFSDTKTASLSDIWVGTPAMPTTDPSGNPPFEMQEFGIWYIQVTSAPGATSDLYYWNISGSIIMTNWDNPVNVCGIEATGVGEGYFSVSSENECGLSPAATGEVFVSDLFSLMVSPNPAQSDSEVQITISEISIEASSLIEKKASESLYYLRLFDSKGSLVYSTRVEGKLIRFPTTNLKNGLYIVEISQGKKVSRAKLVINSND